MNKKGEKKEDENQEMYIDGKNKREKRDRDRPNEPRAISSVSGVCSVRNTREREKREEIGGEHLRECAQSKPKHTRLNL